MNTRPAAFIARFRAFGWDYLLILAYLPLPTALGWAVVWILGPEAKHRQLFESAWMQDTMAFLLLVLPVVLYFAASESRRGATWGKRKLGLQVVSIDGSILGFRQTIVRSLLKFLPWQLAHTGLYQGVVGGETSLSLFAFILAYLLAGIFLVFALFRRDHRTPYDLASGTNVIHCSEREPAA